MSPFGDSPDEFEGNAFHPSLEGGKSSGTIRIRLDSLSFETETLNVEFPLHEIDVSFGGPADRYIFFRHPSHPEWSIFTDNCNILSHRALSRNRRVTDQVSRIYAKRRRVTIILFTLAILLCLAVYGLFQLKEPLVNYLTSRIPISWEQKLGETVFAHVALTNTIIENRAMQSTLEKITDPVVNGIQDSKYQFRFHVIDNPTINAFALPGGHIVIHSGLLNAAEFPEEIAGVLAHEVAHVTLRHSLRQLVSSTGFFLLAQAVLGNSGGLLEVLAERSTFLLTQKFSRDYEREADDQGWSYLLNANINPMGMIQFFKRLKDEEEQSRSSSPDPLNDTLVFLSTHPTNDERIERLLTKHAKLNQTSTFLRFNVDLNELKNQLKN